MAIDSTALDAAVVELGNLANTDPPDPHAKASYRLAQVIQALVKRVNEDQGTISALQAAAANAPVSSPAEQAAEDAVASAAESATAPAAPVAPVTPVAPDSGAASVAPVAPVASDSSAPVTGA
jgi:hypothetical protein